MFWFVVVVDCVIKVYDVCGLVGEEIDELLVIDFGVVFVWLMWIEDV